MSPGRADDVAGIGQRVLVRLGDGEAQALQRRIQLGGIDDGGACALITRHLGEIADDRDFGAASERQRVVLVAQQHDALARALLGHFVVLFHSADAQGRFGIAALERLFGGEHQVEQTVERLVEVLDVQLTVLERRNDAVVLVARTALVQVGGYLVALGQSLEQVLVGIQAAGHLQLVACDKTHDAVVAARPVGDHDVLVSPLVAQDVAPGRAGSRWHACR